MKPSNNQSAPRKVIKLNLNNQGFVKLQRSILTSPVFADPNLFRVYIWCLLKASFKEKTFRIKTGRGYTLVTCRRGTFISGRLVGSESLGLRPPTFYNYLKRIEKLGEIVLHPKRHFTLVEVVGYDNHKTNFRASNRTSTRQPSITTKNEEKGKKEKNSINKYKYYFKNIDRTKHPKQLLQDYESVAKKIHSQFKNIRKVSNIFSIEDLAEVEAKYSFDSIMETLEAMNGWDSIRKCLVVKSMLSSWLRRNRTEMLDENPRKAPLNQDFINTMRELGKKYENDIDNE